MWQALGSLGLGFMSNALNQMMSESSNKRLQENQARLNYEYAEKSARNNPTWNRAGLESAGYNPMLAVQNATSGANSSWSSGAQTGMQDATSSASNFLANAQSVKRLENETKTAQATQDEAYANADKAKAEKNTILQKLPFVSQREKAEISNIEKDSMHKESLIHQIDETIRLRQKELELQQYLGESGLAVQRRGQDISYNASKYATDVDSETKRGTYTIHMPFGVGSQTGYLSPDSDVRHNLYHTGTHYSDNKPRYKGYSNDRKYWSNYYY